jgi:hypothetical protein
MRYVTLLVSSLATLDRGLVYRASARWAPDQTGCGDREHALPCGGAGGRRARWCVLQHMGGGT